MSTPRQRSKQFIEASGYIVTPVEQMVKFPDNKKPRCGACHRGQDITILKDAFQFGDFLYCGNGEIGLCQTTSKDNISSRINKILGLNEPKVWLESGGKIVVHGWAKQGRFWMVTIQEITLSNGNPGAVNPRITMKPGDIQEAALEYDDSQDQTAIPF
jgi:hypothetical protein